MMAGKNSLKKGIIFALLSVVCYSLINLLASLLQVHLPLSQVAFVKSLLSLSFALPYALYRKISLRTKYVRLHFLRGLAGFGGYYFLFVSLRSLSLTDATTLHYLFPLFLPLIGFLWLKERILKKSWIAVGVGFLGSILVLNPLWNVFQWETLWPLASATCTAIALTSVRALNLKEEPVERTLIYFFFWGCTIPFPFLLFQWLPPTPQEWISLLSIGFFSLLNQLFLTHALRNGPLSLIGPLSYGTIALASFFDWWIWEIPPTWQAMEGVCLIFLGGGIIYSMGRREGLSLKEV